MGRVDAYPVCDFEHKCEEMQSSPETKADALGRQRWPALFGNLWSPVGVLAVAAAAVCVYAFVPAPALHYSPTSASPARVLLGPSQLKGGVVQLERHAGSSVARLRVVTHTVWTDYRDLDAMLTIWKQSLARKQPLMVIWDVRSLTFPRVRGEQINQVREFIDEFAEPFDTYVQAHIIILSNPIVRTFARVLLHFFEPPQPYIITKSDEGADEFAANCCNHPRSYRKKKYNKNHKFTSMWS